MADIPNRGNLNNYIPTGGTEPKSVNPANKQKIYSEYFAKDKKMKKDEEISKIREKPGESNAGKYHTKGPFAGPDKTFPINTESRARNALSRAHFAKNPSAIKEKVYKEYPGLAKRANERK